MYFDYVFDYITYQPISEALSVTPRHLGNAYHEPLTFTEGTNDVPGDHTERHRRPGVVVLP